MWKRGQGIPSRDGARLIIGLPLLGETGSRAERLSASVSVSLRHYYPERWDGIGDDFTIRQHVKDVARFIDVLGAGRVHLLGHSRGGNIAFWVGRYYPERVSSLILAEPGSELDDALKAAFKTSGGSEPAVSLNPNNFREQAVDCIGRGDLDQVSRYLSTG